MKFLVEFGDSREVFTCDKDVFTDTMKLEIKDLMGIPSCNFKVQVYDQEWESFVNIKIGDVLEDKQRLKCILNSLNMKEESVCSQSVPLSANNTEIEMSPISKTVVPSMKVMEVKMTESLKCCLNKGQALDWARKHELLQLLADTLYKINKLPPKDIKEKMAKNLVDAYPHLKERLGSGWDGWIVKLDNALKAMRGKDPELENRKRKSVQPSEPTSAKRGAVNWAPDVLDDETIIKAHQVELRKECSKTEKIQDCAKIKELMNATYSHRRQLINSDDALPLSDIKEIYPALFTGKEIYNEFTRLMGVDMDETFLKEFPDMARRIVNHAMGKKKKIGGIEAVLSALERAEAASKDNGNHRMTAALLLLPILLKENPGCIYKELEEETPSAEEVVDIVESDNATPSLVVAGSPFSSSLIYFVGEDNILLESCEFVQSFCLLFGLYYILNLEYPKEGKKTFIFIQKCILGIKDNEKIPTSINSLISALNAKR